MNAARGCLLAVFLSGIVWPLQAADKKTENAQEASGLELSKDEQAVLDLVNQERDKNKLPALKPNAQLFEAARAHAQNMAKQKKMSHRLDGKGHSERAADAGFRGSTAENCASGARVTPQKAFTMWMNSKDGHRENLLDGRWLVTGIGVARTENGYLFYAQVFGSEKGKKGK